MRASICMEPSEATPSGAKNVALGLEVRVDIETEVEGQTEKWQSKNSSQRLWAVERGDKNEGMKEGLRVVKCKQRHRKVNEATQAQVKEAAGTSSKKVAGDFPTSMRLKKKKTTMITQEKTKT